MAAAELRSLAIEGTLRREDHIRRASSQNWVLAESVKGLFVEFGRLSTSDSEASPTYSCEDDVRENRSLTAIPAVGSHENYGQSEGHQTEQETTPPTDYFLLGLSIIFCGIGLYLVFTGATATLCTWLFVGSTVIFALFLLVGNWAQTDGPGERWCAGALFLMAIGVCWSTHSAKYRGGINTELLDRSAIMLIGHWAESGGFLNRPSSQWHGSGFVYERSGDVLRLITNSHCLGLFQMARAGAGQLDGRADVAAYEMTIIFPSGKQAKVSQIAETSVEGLDIAKLEVSADGLQEGVDYIVVPVVPSTILRLGVKPGDEVVAVGTPLGPQYMSSQTYGHISALRRRKGESTLWLQHDAVIAPGSSGGPLFLRQGNRAYLIGVNTLGERGYAFNSAVSSDVFVHQEFEWEAASPMGAAKLISRVYHVAANDASNTLPTPVSKPFSFDLLGISNRPKTPWITIIFLICLFARMLYHNFRSS